MKKLMSGMLVVAAALMTACGPVETNAAPVDDAASSTNVLDCNSGNFCKYDSQCGADGVCYKGRCACI